MTKTVVVKEEQCVICWGWQQFHVAPAAVEIQRCEAAAVVHFRLIVNVAVDDIQAVQQQRKTGQQIVWIARDTETHHTSRQQ